MIDCRQFIITNKQDLYVGEGFLKMVVSYKEEKIYIYYDQVLHIQQIEAGCVLIGDAFQCDINKESPVKELAFSYRSDCDIVDTYKTWSGRYVLIWKNQIHLDAAGMLGLFYFSDGTTYYISSSLALIERITGTPHRQQAILQWNKGGSWNPIPLTILENVKKLLPTQFISIDGTLKINFRLAIKKYENKSKEEILRRIIELNQGLLINIEKQSKNIVLSLTSGVDSRAQFALCVNSGINFSTVTYEKKGISSADVKIPQKLSKMFGLKHSYIRLQSFDANKAKEIKEHTCGNAENVTTRYWYPYGCWNKVTADVFLKNNVWEIVWSSLVKFKEGNTVDELLKATEKDWGNLYQAEYHKASWKEYFEYVLENPIPSMNMSQRVYYDQIIGGEYSDNEQSIDVVNTIGIRLHPFNCLEMINLGLSLDDNTVADKQWERDIIQMLYPEMDNLPYNSRTLYENVLRIPLYLRAKLKNIKNFLK